MNAPAALLWRHLRVFQVWGSNTDVGKTIFSTALCKAAAKHHSHEKVAFLKPVSTGAPHEADSSHMRTYAPKIANDTLFQYEVACSPHSAAKVSGQAVPTDSAVLAEIRSHAARRAAVGPGWLFIETAGGVHSPGPSGTPQADLYAPMRVPALLVGDSKLGGISQTLAAYESLKLRGQDVEAIMLFQDDQYENHLYLQDYFKASDVPVYTISKPPQRIANDQAEHDSMAAYYERLSSDPSMSDLLANLDKRSEDRINRLETMNQKATNTIWYPFTQQKLLSASQITTIDSAHGDFFQVLSPAATSDQALLQPAFDGSASWWTQGLGHGNSKLTLAASYAAGRYGHVMFASSVHEPALALAETLLENMRNPRLTRVFYSDNGSTGCEVATKMALRAARLRYGWSAKDKVGILGLRGSYHGDTMGAMDCSEPGVFNEKVEWYTGKGHWLDFPTVRCLEGRWQVDVPEALQADLGCGGETFESLDEVFRLDERIGSAIHKAYEDHILRELQRLVSRGHKFGALMLEPVVLGAGGMILADPLFQRTLVEVVRSSSSQLFSASTQHSPPDDGPSDTDWSGLPVIFDEVFVGLYRLGRFSAASLLGVHPDISVHAKLLTGGLVPLCATLASESIFAAFGSDDKSDALLHGHSYTAHPVGCQVALESLREMNSMHASGDWSWAWSQSQQQEPAQRRLRVAEEAPLVWSLWSSDFVDQVSHMAARVEGLWALGSVLAITLRDGAGSGYKSTAAADLQARLRSGSDDGSWTAHTRVLGNVFYIMASQKTNEATVRGLEKLIVKALTE
ncbi:bifunctional dethiobiotin synthetase/adenosylmethionine-8-amino-7-oxononanoate aminotransferase [Microdochium bolleyi]|uniref:Bifunctional dethiobiotin synthetase/adenosylmethionine-8-amino-7-oxononanoate aminotransferase n=1 Tax=Microdochium bolleyi TaxID=196109 RepID=A0A136IVD6_9PEZI|nr:bifunctional dethiobiotin synthetase/adenosylmethionine-8-amino-7-oxononanoate aminotransferase [Microdochium bolleyi]